MIKQLEVRPFGMYGKLAIRLEGLQKKYPEKFIPIKVVNKSNCTVFTLTSYELREILFFLRDLGLIEISPIGIKINYKVKLNNTFYNTYTEKECNINQK